MATFETHFVADPKATVETKDPYFSLIHDASFCSRMCRELGVDEGAGLIVNGHVPVKIEKGESPLKRSGRAVTIDGAFSEAYGDRGYTLVLEAGRTALAQHHHFESVFDAVAEGADIIPVVTSIPRPTLQRVPSPTPSRARRCGARSRCWRRSSTPTRRTSSRSSRDARALRGAPRRRGVLHPGAAPVTDGAPSGRLRLRRRRSPSSLDRAELPAPRLRARSPGPYTPARFASDLPSASHPEGLAEGRARRSSPWRAATRCARPLSAGVGGPRGEGGAQFLAALPGGHDDLYCSYRVRFAPGFDFVRGGKLPGLVGGSHPTGGRPADDGFSARLMWRTGGAVVHYVYYPRQSTTYGVDLPYLLAGAPARFQPGAWHRVEHRVVMNTPGRADGILQAWIDGQPALDERDRVWRLDASVHVDALYFSTFFGGNDPSWGPSRDESVDFDDFVVSPRPIGAERRD